MSNPLQSNVNDVIKKLALKWLLDQLATMTGHADWLKLKAFIHAKVAAAIPSQFLDRPLDLLLDEVVDAVRLACADQADLDALVLDCLASDWVKAQADLKALLAKVSAQTPMAKELHDLLAA